MYRLSEEEKGKLQEKLNNLKIEHRDMDEIILKLQETPNTDDLQLRRLKKRKLQLKDMIAYIENMLIPDILA
jgi:hypothetical protein